MASKQLAVSLPEGSECSGICTHPDHILSGGLPQTGTITPTTVNSNCEGNKVVREGDIVTGDICGHTGIIDPLPGSKSSCEGKAVAFVTHTYSGIFSGTIVKGASNSEVGI